MFLRFIVLAITALGISSVAHASAPGGCRMSFKVHINTTVLFQSGTGTGRLTCKDASGKVKSAIPVDIAISGIGLGIGYFKYEGISGNLGWVNGSQIEGTYAVADANAALGVGLGANLNFYGQDNGISFGGAIKAGEGLGVALTGSKWTVTIK